MSRGFFPVPCPYGMWTPSASDTLCHCRVCTNDRGPLSPAVQYAVQEMHKARLTVPTTHERYTKATKAMVEFVRKVNKLEDEWKALRKQWEDLRKSEEAETIRKEWTDSHAALLMEVSPDVRELAHFLPGDVAVEVARAEDAEREKEKE